MIMLYGSPKQVDLYFGAGGGLPPARSFCNISDTGPVSALLRDIKNLWSQKHIASQEVMRGIPSITEQGGAVSFEVHNATCL
jgi:hypothetical protein